MASIRITPLHVALGAEVAGIDLSAPIDEHDRATLTHALADHLALVFHDQTLTPAQYLAAASVFGPPMEQHYSQHNMPEYPLIGLIWHRNASSRPSGGTRTTPIASVRPRRPSCTAWRFRRPAAAPASRACERHSRPCTMTS